MRYTFQWPLGKWHKIMMDCLRLCVDCVTGSLCWYPAHTEGVSWPLSSKPQFVTNSFQLATCHLCRKGKEKKTEKHWGSLCVIAVGSGVVPEEGRCVEIWSIYSRERDDQDAEIWSCLLLCKHPDSQSHTQINTLVCTLLELCSQTLSSAPPILGPLCQGKRCVFLTGKPGTVVSSMHHLCIAVAASLRNVVLWSNLGLFFLAMVSSQLLICYKCFVFT